MIAKRVYENLDFKRGLTPKESLNIGADRIPEIGDTIMVDAGRKDYTAKIHYKTGDVPYGPDEGVQPMKVTSKVNYYPATDSKGMIIMPESLQCYVEYKGEEHIAWYVPYWFDRWTLTGPRKYPEGDWNPILVGEYEKYFKNK